MANRLKGETPLVLADGREFTLVLDMEAMLSIEERMGKPLPAVLKQASEGFLTATAAIALAAFARLHPEITRSDVLAMITSDGEALVDGIGHAFASSFPDQAKGGNAPPAKSRPGKTSGGSGVKPA